MVKDREDWHRLQTTNLKMRTIRGIAPLRTENVSWYVQALITVYMPSASCFFSTIFTGIHACPSIWGEGSLMIIGSLTSYFGNAEDSVDKKWIYILPIRISRYFEVI